VVYAFWEGGARPTEWLYTAEEAATSPAILVPGDSLQLLDTSGDEPPDVINWSSFLRRYLIASWMQQRRSLGFGMRGERSPNYAIKIF
jgi:hypothetical protein